MSCQDCEQTIRTRLSSWPDIVENAPAALPDFVSQSFDHESTVPIAVVCIDDCLAMLGATRYALDRYCAVGTEHRSQGDEMGAVFFEKYYLDDVALRLYSAAEHLANAILALVESTNDDLVGIGGSSQWERVRKYMNREHAALQITRAITELRQSRAWRFTMGYRGNWVHNQPPNVAGLGVRYERKKRWQGSSDGTTRRLMIGRGDAPKHTIGDVADAFIQAFADFLPVYETVVESYRRILTEAGIDDENGRLTTILGNRSLAP